MRLLALLVAFTLSSLACVGCARSNAPASPVHVAESGRLRVKFKSAFAAPPVDMSARDANDVRAALDAEHAVIEHLRRSGYDVVDRITLTTEPKRVPYGIVDGVRDSKKLSSYAEGSRKAKSR